jgi:hypothetical protein
MSRNVTEQLSNLTKCSVCIDTFVDPRILPCVHTYCRKCIEGFTNDKLPGDYVTCPICRNEFILPDNGVEDFPKNFFIEQLKDLTDPSSKHCEECCDDVTNPALRKQAVKYCVDCQQRFCESCVEIHRKAKMSRGHTFFDSCDGENIRAAVRKMKTIFCNRHPSETVKMYCLNCKEAICMMCFAESHKWHECSDINKVVDEFRQQMTNDIKNMNETIKKCQDALKEQEKKKDYFNRTVEKIEEGILERAEKLRKMIDLEKQKLLQELASRKGDRIKQIKRVTENIEQHISFVVSLAKYTEELRDQGSSSDVAQQERTLHNRADELMKTDINREVCDLGPVHVSLEAAKLSTEATGCLIGRIKWQNVKGYSLFYVSPLFVCLSSKKKRFNDLGPMRICQSVTAILPYACMRLCARARIWEQIMCIHHEVSLNSYLKGSLC